MSVTYRNQTEPPTVPGWYFARWPWPGRGDHPEPREVIRQQGGALVAFGWPGVVEIADLDWFGPVTPCREG
ncbi:MAG: hypothetical protein V4564_07645 [Pseudomonadota bacterium]